MANLTIKDIARIAGVSVSTVSLVLSNRGYVSEKTRQKVERVIAEQGYYPRRSARHLASNHTGNFGFIASEIHLSQSEFFYSRVLLGAELEARNLDYYVLLTSVGENFDARTDVPRFLKSRDVDGIIVAGSVPTNLVAYIQKRNIPLVLVDFKLPSIRSHKVSIENFDGAYQAVSHLLEIGRKRLAFVGGSHFHHSIKDRFRGYREALQDAGLGQVAESPVLHYLTDEETTSQIGFEGICSLIDSGADPDSIICANDTTAIGCLQALQQRKIQVPEQIAVVGFDDIGYAAHTHPPLTTVHVPKAEMGIQAVRILADVLANPEEKIQARVVHTELIVRQSTVNSRTGSEPAA